VAESSAGYAGGDGSGIFYYVTLDLAEQDYANNRSRFYIKCRMQRNSSNGSRYWYGWNTPANWTLTGIGTINQPMPPYNFNMGVGTQVIQVERSDIWIGHDAEGNLGVVTLSGYHNASNQPYLGEAWASTAIGVPRIPKAPYVSTGTATNLLAYSFTASGTVTDERGAGVTSRGIVYNTTGNPYIGNGTAIGAGAGGGGFSANLSGLTRNTTYYWRAYATNSMGTSYGSIQTTKTLIGIINTNINMLLKNKITVKYRKVNNISINILLSNFIKITGLSKLKDTSARTPKTYLYKVYDPTGAFIGVWNDVIDNPEYSQEINSLGSTMTVELARNSDSKSVIVDTIKDETGVEIQTDLGEPLITVTETKNKLGAGTSIELNNRVDIWVYYGNVEPLLDNYGDPILTETGEIILVNMGAPNGVRLFTGFISEINSRYGNTETTVVQLTTYGYDLAQYPIKSGNDLTVSYNSSDPSNITKDLLTKFMAQSSGTYTTFTDDSIQLTGTSVSYKFRTNTYADGLKKIIDLAPSNWYYFVGLGDNVIYLRPRATTAKHTFYLGKHIKALDMKSNIMNTVNDIIFTGGEMSPQDEVDNILFKRFTANPANRTRRGLDIMSDSRVTVEASADVIMSSEIQNKNKIQYRTTIQILDTTYDIEKIQLGDMVDFRNFDNYIDELLMQIVGINYTPDVVTLQLDTLPLTINKRMEDIRRNQKVIENQGDPTTPITTVL
jgi:hypothetical protein